MGPCRPIQLEHGGIAQHDEAPGESRVGGRRKKGGGG